MQSAPVKVLGFGGSLRRGSFNAAALRAASEVLPAGMSLEIHDIAAIPFYNADVEAAGFPQPVVHFKDAIARADALLIATPEYNYSVSGVLKNAIDWASRPPAESPLSGKPVAIIGASPGTGGTVRAQLHLRQIGVFTNMYVMPRPEVLIAKAHEKFDASGRLVDEPTREHLRKLLIALGEWTRKLRG